MDRSLCRIDTNTEAFAGMHSQAELALLGLVGSWQVVPLQLVRKATFNGLLSEAARFSGKDDQTLAGEINVSQGYMSRCMRGVFDQWQRRFIKYLRSTQSLAPLQKIADQVGCDIVLRDSRAAEVAHLQQRLRELGQAA